jgi:hypothetical protein
MNKAKTKKRGTFPQPCKPADNSKVRRVTIPAGREYFIFPEGETLDTFLEHAAKRGYEDCQQHYQSDKDAAAINQCLASPAEVRKQIYNALLNHNPKEQNKIIAGILMDVAKMREQLMDNEQKQFEHHEERLMRAKASYEGLRKIMAGGYEDLNFE